MTGPETPLDKQLRDLHHPLAGEGPLADVTARLVREGELYLYRRLQN